MQALSKRIDQKQKELRAFSDDEIRQMHLDIYDLSKKDKNAVDPVLHAAISREVQRRWQSTSWIWKRKSHAEDYEKWNAHNRESEIRATLYAIDEYSHRSDPESKKTLEGLRSYLKTLRSH